MENGLPKELPYVDSLVENNGWRNAWGDVRVGGHIAMKALPGYTSASTILDGALLWQDYEFTAELLRSRGHAFVLGAVKHSRSYYACAYGEDAVRLQHVDGDIVETLAHSPLEVEPGIHRLSIRVGGGEVSCLKDRVVVLTADTGTADLSGGVGLQVWAEAPGTALLQVYRVEVIPR
jgi:hypothetical protein